MNCGVSASSEGWALYAERLMDELGYLTRPGDRLGYLFMPPDWQPAGGLAGTPDR